MTGAGENGQGGTPVQQLTVGEDEAEQRLDRWFRRRFPHVTQGRLEKMCRKGEVRVDGGRVKTSSRVAPGQVVRVPPLPAPGPEDARPAAPAPEPSDADARMLADAVIFRDDHMIVLNKPAGLAVQGGSGQTRHLGSLLAALRFGRDDDPRLVHRIDKDTSGLLVLARTGAAAVALAKLFRSRAVEKIYFAVVAGKPEPKAGTIRYGLVKAGGQGEGEKMRTLLPDEVKATPGAKAATTDYRVVEQAGNRAAWVVMKPVTGRTHQLRAHMAAIGCPIAGDGKYGDREFNRELRDLGLKRLFLHASRIRIPGTGRLATGIDAPLPPELSEFLNGLE